VKGKLQEHIIAENKQTNKQAKMIENCETKYYNSSNDSIKLIMIRRSELNKTL
jgi:hypothetical protein